MSAPKGEKKNLFESDSDEDHSLGKKVEDDDTFKINKKYASQYDEVKRKKELQRLTDKFGKDAAIEDSDEEDEEEGEEDATANLLTKKKENMFAEVFASLRKNDTRVKDKNVKFFKELDEDEDSSDDEATSGNKFTLRDEYKRAVMSGEQGVNVADNDITEDQRKKKLRPQSDAERKARNAFLAAAEEEVDETAADFSIKRTAAVAADDDDEPVEEGGAEWKQTLAGAFDTSNKEESFLKEFFVNELWRGGNTAGDDDDVNWDQMAADEQDEMFFEDQEQWERDFQDKQFRHEDGTDAVQIQTFPRQQEGLLRKKETTRADARDRKAERQKEESHKMTEELKRLKALKRKDIDQKRSMIEQVAGLQEEAMLGKISKEDLEKDFDPEEFDKMMAKMFDPSYYDGIDDDEVARMEEEDMLFGPEDGEGDLLPEGAPEDNDDLFAGTALPGGMAPGEEDLDALYPSAQLTTATNTSEKTKKGAATAQVEALQKSKDELQKELDQQIDEYWKLHYHKVAGGVRTRFKYKEVNPESFSLSDIDVLTKDDRTLNMIAPLSGYATYLGKKENLIDRYKAAHRRKNQRELNPERKSRRYGELKKTIILSEDMADEDKAKLAENISKTNQSLGETNVTVRDPEATAAAPGQGPSGAKQDAGGYHGGPKKEQPTANAAPKQQGGFRMLPKKDSNNKRSSGPAGSDARADKRKRRE